MNEIMALIEAYRDGILFSKAMIMLCVFGPLVFVFVMWIVESWLGRTERNL